MSSTYHPRASFWAEFAAARLSQPGATVEAAAADADHLMKEFDKRWEWYDGGYGTYWTERRRPLKKERA